MEIIMSICTHRVCVVLAACLAFFLATPGSHGLVLDWGTAAWSPAWSPGSLANSYDLNGDQINDITVAIAKRGNGPVFTPGTPAINQLITGGLAPVENSLMIAGDLFTNSDVTVHLSFTGAQPGAANVSFTIFDIDLTTNNDIISNIYGVALDGTQVAATITNVGSGVSLTGTGLTQTLTGNTLIANNSSNGNATISFGSAIIKDVFFTFSNNAGAPFYQDIGMGDITFTPVPEINPTAASAVSCLFALGLTVVLNRRKARQRSAEDPAS